MPTQLLSADDLLQLPRGTARRELVRGELRSMSPANHTHGWVAASFARLLANHVVAHHAGRVYGAETGFLLARDPDTVLAPDVAFVRSERLGGIPADGWFPGPPDLAVEIRSPRDSAQQVAEKAAAWLRHGCRVVVAVDPSARCLHEWRATDDPAGRSCGTVWSAGDLLSGFVLHVDDLFAA